MKSLLERRRRTADPVVVDTTEQVDEHLAPPVADGSDQVTSTLATKAAAAFLWCLLLLGPLGFGLAILALSAPSTPPPAPVSTASQDADEQARAAEFAQRVVTAWLTATRTDAEELQALVENPAPVPLTAQAFTVEDVTTAGIVPAGQGVWSVTVAATVTDESDRRHRRYLQVPVMVAEGSVTALSLPAVVTGPVAAKPPTSTYRHQVPRTSPVTLSVSGFLVAYLTGSGDLTRYLTPGVEITAVTPAPFVEVEVVEVRSTTAPDSEVPADGQQVRVLVTAAGTVAQEQTLTTTYALSLTSRAGRWEVSTLEAAPALANQLVEPSPDSVVPLTQGGSSPTDG